VQQLTCMIRKSTIACDATKMLFEISKQQYFSICCYCMCSNVLQDGANVIHCIEHRDKNAHVRPDIFVYGDCVQCFGKIQVLLLLNYHSIVVSSMKSVRKTLPITLEPELESETNKRDFMRVSSSSTNIFVHPPFGSGSSRRAKVQNRVSAAVN
jgi:hypothetical protein